VKICEEARRDKAPRFRILAAGQWRRKIAEHNLIEIYWLIDLAASFKIE
jgi:hypothetical protein